MKKNKAIILDRDGTINVEKNYVFKISDFEFIKNTFEAIKIFNDLGYKVIIITNQSGIGRGYFTKHDLCKLNEYILKIAKSNECKIDEFYYCPHYNIECNCRKPKLGLYEKAIEDFNIDVKNSWAVGDKTTDLIGPNKLNMKTVLVLTGYGKSEKPLSNTKVFENLYDFAVNLKKGL